MVFSYCDCHSSPCSHCHWPTDPLKNEEKGRGGFHADFPTDGIASRNTFDSIKLNKHLLNIVTGLNASARIKNSTAWPLPVSFSRWGDKCIDLQLQSPVKSAVIFFYECNGRLPFNIKNILAAQWDTGIHSAELQDQQY